jgi:hypothetical protein
MPVAAELSAGGLIKQVLITGYDRIRPQARDIGEDAVGDIQGRIRRGQSSRVVNGQLRCTEHNGKRITVGAEDTASYAAEKIIFHHQNATVDVLDAVNYVHKLPVPH